MSKTFERRMAVGGLELREASDTVTLTGYASTFDQPYDMGWYTETVDQGAFKRTLGQHPDVRLLINHAGLPLARTASGTLTLADKDEKGHPLPGLMVSARLDASDPDVAALVPKMRRGDLNQMSFAFRTQEDSWNNDMTKRTLLGLDLADGDVSIVTYPANPNATAAIRSAGVPPLDAITFALRALETRGAVSEDIASVLTRALAYFTAVDAVDETPEVEDAPTPDEIDPAAEALAATVAHELRQRALRLAG